jgi:hypothetical protein
MSFKQQAVAAEWTRISRDRAVVRLVPLFFQFLDSDVIMA